MEQLKHMKETLIGCIQAQMSHLDTVDTKELGEVIDMVKDLEEAIYYSTITKAMEEKSEGKEYHYYTEYRHPEKERDMDRENGKMYYNMMPTTYSNGNGNGSSMSSGNGSRNYSEFEYPMMRDSREGRSPMSRKTYMESKEMHQPKTTQMKELEKYLQELSSDITEMIQDASPEEKSFLEKKISALATKINQVQ